MPITAPTVAEDPVHGADTTSTQTAVNTICGHIDTTNTAVSTGDSAIKTAMRNWLTATYQVAMENARTESVKADLTAAYLAAQTALA